MSNVYRHDRVNDRCPKQIDRESTRERGKEMVESGRRCGVLRACIRFSTVGLLENETGKA